MITNLELDTDILYIDIDSSIKNENDVKLLNDFHTRFETRVDSFIVKIDDKRIIKTRDFEQVERAVINE